jgi:AAA+ superfamily predicted ATPase
VLSYALPDIEQIRRLIRARLPKSAAKNARWKELAESGIGLSYAEITRALEEVLKEALIQGTELIQESDIRRMLEERKRILQKVSERP